MIREKGGGPRYGELRSQRCGRCAINGDELGLIETGEASRVRSGGAQKFEAFAQRLGCIEIGHGKHGTEAVVQLDRKHAANLRSTAISDRLVVAAIDIDR